MRQYHEFAGYAIVGGWLLLFGWGCVLWLVKRDANRWYWGLVKVLEALLGLQLVAGVVLVVAGGRPAWLHYLYGAVLPLLVLMIAHVLTSGLDKPPYHPVFTVTSFIMFALAARALMTGLAG